LFVRQARCPGSLLLLLPVTRPPRCKNLGISRYSKCSLRAASSDVSAVQNPLTSLSDDVTATKRIIALQDGRVILVGHSLGWHGNHPSRRRSEGLRPCLCHRIHSGCRHSENETSFPFGLTPGQKTITVDAQHLASLKPEGVFESVAEGLPMEERHFFL